MEDFLWQIEQFDDIRILRYQVPSFESLTLNEKIFIYYLSKASIVGRDILWDQNNIHNLSLRKVLEQIIINFKGDRETEEFNCLLIYAKKVFFANGVHHHYSMQKFTPSFSKEYFKHLLDELSMPEKYDELERIVFDTEYMSKRVVLDGDKDLVNSSANNYYHNLTQSEVEDYYKTLSKDDKISYGLNSRLVKDESGCIYEEKWCVGGKYGKEIEQIMKYLNLAFPYACSLQQQNVIKHLVEFYSTGDLTIFDTYSIEWLKDTNGKIDFLNGFIEVYGDPLAYKASWEAMVQIVDEEACARPKKMADNALWFEKNAPIDDRFKKDEVKGISAKVMQVAMLGGDCYPATPIGINLPNAEWIRESYGSKSVTLDNITYAYDMAAANSGVLEAFAYDIDEIERAKRYGSLASSVHTDLHECLGHGSGRMLEGVGTDALRNYYSTIEEARADLFALYYIMDEKLIELGIIPNIDAAKAEYDAYIRNGLMLQLARVDLGENLEESHMRNRQIIASWACERGCDQKVIERIEKDGSTYFRINDYVALRKIFAELLIEIQRIKSEGDFDAASKLVENYGVSIDYNLHKEVKERYTALGIAPYAGFINPEYNLVKNEVGEIIDVTITYPSDFLQQMLAYGVDR